MTEEASVRVVLVEDSAELRLIARLMFDFEEWAEVVGEAADGAEGLDVISAQQPDVAVVDLHMPRMGGVEMIGELRRRGMTTHLVAYSADDAELVRATAAGADVALRKTGDVDELLEAVRSAGR